MASEFNDARSIGEALGKLTGRGVYSIEVLEDVFPRFGFTYDRSTDELCLMERRVIVGSRDALTVAAEIQSRDGGVVSDYLDPHIPLAGAVAISDAVFRLLFPGRTPWSRPYSDRDRAFAANCAAIRSGHGAQTWTH